MPHSTGVQSQELDNQHFDVLPLETVNFARLEKKDQGELKRLLKAAQSPGFFHLDLQDEPNDFIGKLRHVYAISEKYFKPNEEQAAFEIGRDKTNDGSLEFPGVLKEHASELTSFADLSYGVNKKVVAHLSQALGLEGEDALESKNRDGKPSDTALNLIYSPAKRKLADAPDTTHTDSGTLTSLFCDKWGIQVEHPESKAWAFVEPKPGCALVNVADSLQSVSNGRLHSCRHRHTQPIDGFDRRYFVVSYLRPEKVNA